MALDVEQLHELLRFALHYGASDLHLRAGDAPALRVSQDLATLKLEKLSPADTADIARIILASHGRAFEPAAIREVDVGYGVPGLARFRAHIYRQRGSIALVLRVVPTTIPTFEALGLPAILGRVAELPRGLILVTGATGSGKTTTLAAMIDHLNRSQRMHIVTIEDPIEFLHRNVHCAISQREVGSDTESLQTALRAVLREDPDVILVGEMRDLETIRLALSGAETGHLVFGTLHTSSAAKTIDRIVDVFPAAEKEMIRAMISESIKAIIAQTLCKTKDGSGRAAAHEIMVGTPAIRNLIRENKIAQMYSAIQTGQQFGMQTLDQNLQDLVKRNIIAKEEARSKAANKDNFL